MDNKLNEARKKINEIDKKMASLFCERMEAVKTVAECKQELGLPVFDIKREEEVIERNVKNIENSELRSYYINFLKSNMDISKKYQHRLLKGVKVAYSGVPGAFANIAAKRIFPDGNPVSYDSFKSAYDAVVSGECDCAVLPIENSFAGDVSQVMDLAFFGSLYINGVYELAINQNLLGVKGAKLRDIHKVISHPQALAQCTEYISKHGFRKEEASNTALAAKQDFELNDISVAAIASDETAKLYGLDVIDKSINESRNNTTRFAVFSRVANKPKQNDNHFIMFFTVKNEAGTLSRAIEVLGKYGFNLRALKSRPTKQVGWEYYFYVDGEGNICGAQGDAVREEMSKGCSHFKIVGTYEEEMFLKE